MGARVLGLTSMPGVPVAAHAPGNQGATTTRQESCEQQLRYLYHRGERDGDAVDRHTSTPPPQSVAWRLPGLRVGRAPSPGDSDRASVVRVRLGVRPGGGVVPLAPGRAASVHVPGKTITSPAALERAGASRPPVDTARGHAYRAVQPPAPHSLSL